MSNDDWKPHVGYMYERLSTFNSNIFEPKQVFMRLKDNPNSYRDIVIHTDGGFMQQNQCSASYQSKLSFQKTSTSLNFQSEISGNFKKHPSFFGRPLSLRVITWREREREKKETIYGYSSLKTGNGNFCEKIICLCESLTNRHANNSACLPQRYRVNGFSSSQARSHPLTHTH